MPHQLQWKWLALEFISRLPINPQLEYVFRQPLLIRGWDNCQKYEGVAGTGPTFSKLCLLFLSPFLAFCSKVCDASSRN